MRTFQEHISVIIPAFNAAETLPQTLTGLRGAALVKEIVVVDGGSSDDTVRVAWPAAARVITAKPGRGSQLAAGAAAASGQWLLFLHADCRLEPGWEAKVSVFLALPGAAERAGYFDLVLDDDTPAARRLERIVAWRCRK